MPSNCVPHSEGEIILQSADPAVPPKIDFNYFADPHDLKVMVALMRKSLEIAPGNADAVKLLNDAIERERRMAR